MDKIGKKILIIFCSFLFIATAFSPFIQGFSIDKNSKDKSRPSNFSIIIHKIQQHDEIDPFPHNSGGDWRLNLYVKNVKKTYECEGKNLVIDKTFTWYDIIDDSDSSVQIKMELIDRDSGMWPDEDDIADISAFRDNNYYDGKYDDTDDFNSNRPAIFKRNYDLISKIWKPVSSSNDYLRESDDTILNWNITSGNYDGSTIVDENDVSIWFKVSNGNIPPYPPETPSGPIEGWINTPYIFSTKGYDINEDNIKFGWDWDGDSIIDDFTSYYESWETAKYTKTFSEPRIYYVKAIAVDEGNLCSEWSENLKVEINGPYGKSGFEIFEWSLGHIYCTYYDHYETQEILNIMRSGGNIITALSTLISAIATACGVPLDYSAAFAVASALLRLGVEVISLMDRGMGIYTKVYFIEAGGVFLGSLGYAWSQSLGEDLWVPPANNKEPTKPVKPIGESNCELNKNYSFKTSSLDPEKENIKFIVEWSDGNYSIMEDISSGEEVVFYHSWEKEGCYHIRVKALDNYGQESCWSDPLMINVKKNSKSKFRFEDFIFNILNLKNNFYKFIRRTMI